MRVMVVMRYPEPLSMALIGISKAIATGFRSLPRTGGLGPIPQQKALYETVSNANPVCAPTSHMEV